MRILALSPHTDDIELGCGGYLSKMTEQGHSVYVACFSHIYDGVDLTEEHLDSLYFIGVAQNWLFNETVREFDRQRVLQNMINIREEIQPDVVLCPYSDDIHQDHKVVYNEAVRAYSKTHSLLGYELPWNCRGFNGSFFVRLEDRHLRQKMEMLNKYESQKDKHYFNFQFITSLATVRGMQIGGGKAETYEVITWIA